MFQVVSGSESGKLVLWEGEFVKCELILKNGAQNDENSGGRCHLGPIHVVMLDGGNGKG